MTTIATTTNKNDEKNVIIIVRDNKILILLLFFLHYSIRFCPLHADMRTQAQAQAQAISSLYTTYCWMSSRATRVSEWMFVRSAHSVCFILSRSIPASWLFCAHCAFERALICFFIYTCNYRVVKLRRSDLEKKNTQTHCHWNRLTKQCFQYTRT